MQAKLAEQRPQQAELHWLSDDKHDFHDFLYTSDSIKSRGFVPVVWSISPRKEGVREDTDHGLFYHPHTTLMSRYTLLCLYTTTPMGSQEDISTATHNIQMYKYKNKIWEIWMQTRLSNMRSAPLLLAFLSPSHTHNIHFPVLSNWERISLEKSKPKNKNTSHVVAFSAHVPSLCHYWLQLRGLCLSLCALNWSHRGRKEGETEIKAVVNLSGCGYRCPRSGSWL